ncbi:hypothetical protein IEQ34_014661 [Dendrobium chrysotoxum]|uniref:Malate dehydrogenase n=1 Tax=Dendrobium chrysotoxum TaxID=161865 RepID=A0AAV7GMR0_DENCH|nr:hypothetical protein IEQ34_014661 [Dendrobium chrysotoxum]
MSLAEFSPCSYSRYQTLPSNLSSAPLTAFHVHAFKRGRSKLHVRRPLNITCSVAPSQVQSPATAVPVRPADAANKQECYGVFCTTYDLKAEEKTKTWKNLIRIVVSGAAGMISNHLLFKLASGEVFGPDQPIALRLLGSERSYQALEVYCYSRTSYVYSIVLLVSQLYSLNVITWVSKAVYFCDIKRVEGICLDP